MLPPTIGKINNSDILTLYTNPDDSNGRSMVVTQTVSRSRYAEIGVKRNDIFLEPYLHQQGTVQVVSLPNTVLADPLQHHQLTQLHHVQSEESLSSEESTTSEGSSRSTGNSSNEVACDITLIERLIRSHPVWFLPGIQRAGAFHLLQGKEEGNFVVRQSSQNDTMALSVRLPAGKGPYIEHYLIQANNSKLSLETSENRFDNIPSLIAHYSQCCSDELPVQLTLPRTMREAKNRQQLSSLALLGQEFWRYPMANSKPPESNSSNTSSLSSFHGGNNNNNNMETPTTESIVLNLAPLSSDITYTSSPTNTTIANSSTFASSMPRQPRPTPPNTLDLTTFNEPMNNTKRNRHILLPGDKLSQKLISPNLVQSMRCPSPVIHNVENNVLSPVQDMRSFDNLKNSLDTPKLTTVEFSKSSRKFTSISNFHQNLSCTTSPELSDSKNIIIENQGARQNVKTPPPPPPRWAKSGINQNQNNFVTTMVTFNVNQSNSLNPSQQNTPSDPNTSLMSPQSNKSLNSNFFNKLSSPLSPTFPVLSSSLKLIPKISNVISPNTPTNTNKSKRQRNRENRKNSQHYQESDILDSYYRSSPADKISDYEDIWNTTDQSTESTWNDRLKDNKVVCISQNCMKNSNDHLMSPRKSERNLFDERLSIGKQMILRDDKFILKNDKTECKEMISPELSSFKPVLEMKSPDQNSSEATDIRKTPDLLSRVYSVNSLNSTMTSSRNKLGLVLAKSESNSPQTPEFKQSSPFYAEPADAIVQSTIIIPRRRLIKNNSTMNKYRHSEPDWLQTSNNVNQLHSIDCWAEFSEEEDKMPLISSSVDNLAKRLTQTKETKKIPRAKPVQPPKIKTKIINDTFWAVDSSWEFIGNETEESNCEVEYDCNADNDGDPVAKKLSVDEKCNKNIVENTLTVQNIILQRYPELLKSLDTCKSLHTHRNSSYDNVEKRSVKHEDSSNSQKNTYDPSKCKIMLNIDSESDVERTKRNNSFKERLDPLLSLPRVQALSKNRDQLNGIGAAIRAYALQLAADKTTTFSQNIENFIQCTRESKEAIPHVVMRNMRQFMSGMKNYLVKHGERGFEKEVEKERLKLRSNEFLNLDAILEDVLMGLVVKPLREHVCQLFIEHYFTTGALQTLAENIRHAQGKTIYDLGVQSKIIPPSEESLGRILKCIERLQRADSPLEKLKHLLAAISAIFNSVKEANLCRHITLGADDLLPLVIWILVRGKVVDAEIEVEYMWGLLHASLLSGEGGYYLTTFSSAVHVLKTLKSGQTTMSTLNGCGSPDWSSVLRILVPNELHGSLNTRTLPVRPNMNTKEICRILAHKIRCTNPQDYGLFKLVQGEETLLGDHECPQELSHCLFAYKRIDAKIAWPKNSS
ncbi:protein sprint isoform X3 [Monomorium pharaonis]|uniref:protein sprint isoform X3 n=1 Tax=Monomorium pharaonis TaxID=307658 RepID=UPI0017461925|nr:protein sprint isoform X3 [Monomorium pharaonis]